MPALYALGQHPALVELQRHLRPGELVFAYLDDIYVIVPSARARVVFDSTCSGMRASKSTRAKRGLGTPPGSSRQASESLAPLTPRSGSVTRPCRPSNRGSLHLGFPAAILHTLLLNCKPHAPIRLLPDLQLLLLFCASPRCCHLLRSLPPVTLLAFAAAACLADLLGAGPLPDHALRLAQLPFQQGGLNLRSAVALAPAAYWASRADTLPVLHRQLPRFAADVVARLGAGEPVGPTLRGALQSQAALAVAGFDLPTWDAVILGAQAPPSPMSQATTCPNPARGAGRRQLRPQSPRFSRQSSWLSWMCPRRPFCFQSPFHHCFFVFLARLFPQRFCRN